MRKGYNPNKDSLLSASSYTHQVVVPVYIPDFEGYFAKSFSVFKTCIRSLSQTTHSRTFISVVNNGSCVEVRDYLNKLFKEGTIHEVIHTENIGKVNAILKALVGNDIGLITITDADVLFLPEWQKKTYTLFNALPKAGIVGLIPQFKMYETNCDCLLADRLLSKNLRFAEVRDSESMRQFYNSIGWKPNYNPHYLEYALGLFENNVEAYAGNGHVVATYRKDIFDVVRTFSGYKLGGDSEQYLDEAAARKGYWNLTTYDNLAYHMGNEPEEWMEKELDQAAIPTEEDDVPMPVCWPSRKVLSPIRFRWRTSLLRYVLISSKCNRLFLRYKGIPSPISDTY